MKKGFFKVLVGVLAVGCVLTSCQRTETPVESGTSQTGSTDTKTEKKIEVASEPTKKSFVIGDLFTVAGLKIQKYTVSNGTESAKLDVSETEYDLSLPEGTKLTEATSDLQVTVTMKEEGYNTLTLHFVVVAPTEFAVTFENYDGTTLGTASVIEGKTSSYEGSTPTRASADGKFYSFDGWYVKGDASQKIVDLTTYVINENVTFVAHYAESTDTVSDAVLKYGLSADHITVIGFSDNVKDKSTVAIPDTFNNLPVTEVLPEAFSGETDIQTLSIGANVTIIGESAFYDCGSLVSVTFAEGSKLDTIGKYAFRDDGKLTDIKTPASLKHILDSAFYRTALTNLTLNEGLVEIGDSAFGYTSFTTFALPDSVSIFGGSIFGGNDVLGTIKIGKSRKDITSYQLFSGSSEPDAFTSFEVDEANPNLKSVDGILYSKDGKRLISVPLNNYALLQDQEAAKTLTLSDDIESIEPYALTYCQYYTKVIFGSGVVSIGDYAFNYANRINELDLTKATKLQTIGNYAFKGGIGGGYATAKEIAVVLPDSVTTIGDYAFAENSKLTSFTFGAGVTTLGSFIFDRDSNLKDIKFAAGSKLVQEDGLIYSADKTKLMFNISFTGDTYVLPDTVEAINGGVFTNNTTLKTLTISASSKLKSIGEKAFYNASGITGDITLPSTLESIGASAFESASGITNLVIPASVKSIGERAFSYIKANVDKVVLSADAVVGEEAFYNTTNVKEVEIHTKEVGKSLFYRSTGLTKATIGDGITELPESTFDGASSLETVIKPTTLTTIGSSAFSSTTALKEFDFTSITSIGDDSFSGSGLTSITIPDSVTYLGESAFEDATELTSVTLNNKVDVLPDNLFSGASKLQTVSIASKYTGIGNYTFGETTALKSITLPDSLVSIGTYAFNKSGLTSIVIPESVTSIGNSAFANATALASVTLPTKIEALDSGVFSGCTSLTSINLPASLTTIKSSFYGSGLTSLTINGKLDVENSLSVFQNLTSLESIEFKAGLSKPTIGSNMFYGDSALTTIKGLGEIKEVQFGAFQDCTSLTELPFDTTKLEVINMSAFQGMTGLKSFNLPTNDKYTTIEANTFTGATGLTSITLPANITKLGDDAFSDCTNLKEITIENPLLDYENKDTYSPTFEGSGLETVHFNGTQEQAKKTWLGGDLDHIFSWGDSRPVTVICTDGTYTISK